MVGEKRTKRTSRKCETSQKWGGKLFPSGPGPGHKKDVRMGPKGKTRTA